MIKSTLIRRYHAVRSWLRTPQGQSCLVWSAVVTCLALLPFSSVKAMPVQWPGLIKKISSQQQTFVSLRMQQIHSINFMIDTTVWQLQDIQTFENRNRYEFSKNFKCISSLCKPKTVLSLTIVTYKYAAKVYSSDQLEKHFPLTKWKKLFRTGASLSARFSEKIALSDQLGQAGHGYRFTDLNIKNSPAHGLIDLLFYAQSQARLIITSPNTEQKVLQRQINDIEKTIALQPLR